MNPQVILQPRRARPFYGRHPWVYTGAVAEVRGEPADGDEVDLYSHAGDFIARGLYNSRSKIRVRLYSWSPETALDAEFFARANETDAVADRRIEANEVFGSADVEEDRDPPAIGRACRFDPRGVGHGSLRVGSRLAHRLTVQIERCLCGSIRPIEHLGLCPR